MLHAPFQRTIEMPEAPEMAATESSTTSTGPHVRSGMSARATDAGTATHAQRSAIDTGESANGARGMARLRESVRHGRRGSFKAPPRGAPSQSGNARTESPPHGARLVDAERECRDAVAQGVQSEHERRLG